MGKPYSTDLRERVIKEVQANRPIKEIAAIFNVNPKTIYTWRRLDERTGSLEPKEPENKGPKPKIDNLEEFKKFLDTTEANTQEEMARELGNVSKATVGRAIKRIRYSCKKKHSDTPKRTKKSAHLT